MKSSPYVAVLLLEELNLPQAFLGFPLGRVATEATLAVLAYNAILVSLLDDLALDLRYDLCHDASL